MPSGFKGWHLHTLWHTFVHNSPELRESTVAFLSKRSVLESCGVVIGSCSRGLWSNESNGSAICTLVSHTFARKPSNCARHLSSGHEVVSVSVQHSGDVLPMETLHRFYVTFRRRHPITSWKEPSSV